MAKIYSITLVILFSMNVSSCDSGGAWASSKKIKPSNYELLQKAYTWMYQIQGIENTENVQILKQTSYPLLVLEPGSFRQVIHVQYSDEDLVNELRYTPAGSRRLLLAYIDIGQAEEWRTYWKDNWKPPKQKENTPGEFDAGIPDFIAAADPDEWEGNYPVLYWDSRWKDIWLKKDGIVAELTKAGFDGIYLDWVEAYDHEVISKIAEESDLNPAKEMVDFIEQLGKKGREINPQFLVIPQNAPYIIDELSDEDVARYANAIDALAMEDTWFHGTGAAADDWEHAAGCDKTERNELPGWSTKERLSQYKKYHALGVIIFTVDYACKEKNVELVYRRALEEGLRPLVTRVSLKRMTETPPAGMN